MVAVIVMLAKRSETETSSEYEGLESRFWFSTLIDPSVALTPSSSASSSAVVAFAAAPVGEDNQCKIETNNRKNHRPWNQMDNGQQNTNNTYGVLPFSFFHTDN